MILSIESSCDDSSIAIIEIATKKLIYHKKISQELEHSVYGGVVPELASRLHAEVLPRILAECEPWFKELKAVAVTNEPGLGVTLIEGVIMAKALSISLGIPILPINHLKGHIYSLFIEKESILPITVLLVSGGHTQLIEVKSYTEMETIATTMDDSYGESFDKVAKMMHLGYPGGPLIEQLSREGDATKFAFTVPLWQSPLIAFSYSGLKNQVRLAVEANESSAYPDIAAAFQKTATEHLIQKLKKYFKTHPPKRFAIVGGASANLYLRERVMELLKPHKAELFLSELTYCSDNAAMIGRAALEAYALKAFVSFSDIAINPRCKL
ncbi:MAG: tRNA (adenosine(37)-N6)-threonylcarbamoyltransferase complex transferase subunit TsaD [Sulfuricurvum sp.]|uniref:tRNA (adenosine(37)-N6)-threonylcarbamoyltransferase complex transferase subunit TsaD n=1 Tax=Sulfuricurvum sp. TaxID=2025608 RepID=UPI002631AD58|nr:tRNA (adenosine(37)-N6)-threonylcarbamoyltransferase complex transferase subunit TsaD [Sulfuricurvum sp.]MDD2828748.1 tRNA (adenosine(37)-N6)-threonylcarbamoyltransferase complex transferase subunit TsaD [Sulfuricurvum sp.]MDD4949326.1 tRNA (adenosine(37)-N6)-threonylcarbamoyltransferase complex transferase subunit TsaD [Sulfuricurvum sp.]